MSLLHHYVPSLVFLQEVWPPLHDESVMNKDFQDYSFKISTPDMFTPTEDKMMHRGQVWHGVAIGWHTALNSYVTQLQSNYERFAGIKLSSGKSSLLVISLYAPTHGKDDEFLECLSHLSQFILENISENDAVLIGADSNCSVKSTSRRKKAWTDFGSNFSLTSEAGSLPTFHHHNGSSESSIDVILYSKQLKLGDLVQLCTLEHSLNLSSHDVLTTNLSIPFTANPKSKYEHTYCKINRKKVIWNEEHIPAYQTLAAKALSDASEFWDSPEYIPLLCSLFSNLLVKCAELTFVTKVSKEGSKKNSCASKKLRIAKEKLKRTHRLWKRAGKPLEKKSQA